MPQCYREKSKAALHRARLRAQGLRPVLMWVPDTSRPGFAEECARQSRFVAGHQRESLILDLLAQEVAVIEGWEV